MTPTNTEALAIADALEKRLDCSSLVLTADVERAAAELRCLSAENTAAVSAFLAADDERRELRAERDALQRKVQEMALQALADDTQHREVEAERDALRADAERYRWLRNNPQWLGWEHDFRPDEVDREIDAARAAMKGTT